MINLRIQMSRKKINSRKNNKISDELSLNVRNDFQIKIKEGKIHVNIL